ncbi:TPA: type II toxin-antitoxin system RnlA family toxin [Pseudomonas aeruginosa]|nr:type II toxin-antitoxin system RnlA family toxin [Pseudomonas aeruginosa]
MAKGPYQKIALQRDLIPACMARSGAEIVEITTDGKGDEIFSFTHNGTNQKLKLFHLGNGTFTIGYLSGFCKETFNSVAAKLKEECGGEVSPFNYSKARLASRFDDILAFLQHSGAVIEDDKQQDTHRQLRLRGPHKDALSIKVFKNGTVQFQGKKLNLAALLCDYLANVLDLDDAIASRIEIYAIPLTVKQVKDDFEAKAPVSSGSGYIRDSVRAQLSSALALTKIDMPIEDHSFMAYPALRGLEGFMKDLLLHAGFKPKLNADFGDYIQNGQMGADQAAHAGPKITAAMNRCYPFWSDQRHRLFHMDAPSDSSRILSSAESVDLVDRVILLIEETCISLVKA